MPEAANRPGKPERVKLPFEIWALVAGAFAVALGYGVVAPAIPQFALEFGVSQFAASAIVSAFALMRLVGAPLGGVMITRLGERRTYTIGILIVALSTGAAAFATDYTQFVLLRGAGGIGSAMFSVSATALLVKLSPPKARGRVASLNASGFLLGGLLGPVFGALVAGFGLRAPFIFYFFTLLIAATVVAVALRGSTLAAAPPRAHAPERTDPETQGTTDPAANPQPAALTLKQALGISQYRSLLLSAFAFGWASFGIRVSTIPIFVSVAFHGDAAAAAWVLAGYAAGNAVLIFPSGSWSDRFGRKPLLVTGTAVLAASYLVFPLAGSLWVALGIMVVAGAGSALVNPGQMAVLADVLAERRGGTAVSTYSMMSDLGGMIGPLIVGLILDFAGFGWGFGLTAALLGAALIGWMAVPDSQKALGQD